ncbi:cardiolipin synthase [uncultured Clostridium sp.]|uniref:cardiolipin synthase n=1 Tax=uncultured Clostridium sp. TaxID=59620 RepID=UPI0025D96955|nr:cardiolipin synthase [uncultured Clostridium sp.]MDU4883823.1 cardiolipin synthase [Clostridium celatum]MDU7077066.1 cardiolipin synthase [Clostridium celatum]
MAYIVLITMFFLLNLLSALSLIFIERKEPTTTWAWLIILIVLPGIGLILYLLLGQNLSRQKIFREKKLADKIKRYKLISNRELPNFDSEINENYEDLILMNYNHSGAIYTTGNEVKTYINGEDKFRDLFNDIRAAKSFIHIEYYIFRYDDLGKALIRELHEKTKDGVEVRLVIDGMGSKRITKKIIKEIESYGIKMAIFFPGVLPHINTRINYRNHRKIVVIDGKIGYVGGFNVGNEYVNKGKQFKFWRDTHIRVKGEAVNELNKRFILDWDYAADENMGNMSMYFPNPEVVGSVGMQIVSSGPDHMEEYIKNSYMKIINNAKNYVYIQTPYLVPDSPMMEALKISALSGVDVRIIVPGAPDHFFMEWILSANIGLLMEYGIKIYRYGNGFIHSKTIVADGEVCSIGTANLDIRSFKLNFEVNAFIYNEIIAKEQEKIFLDDQLKSKLVTKEEYYKRSRSLKIKESLIRLLAPIL